MKDEMNGALASMRDIGNADNILVGKLQGKKPDGI
jgi:hypothetical protein